MFPSCLSAAGGKDLASDECFPPFLGLCGDGRDSPSPTWALPGCEKASGLLGQLEQELPLASAMQGEPLC